MEKEEALRFPAQKAALVHTGSFLSGSHTALESGREVLPKVKSADLEISWELSHCSRPGQNQHSRLLMCKAKDVLPPSLLFSLPCIFTSLQK